MRKNTARHWLHAGLDLLPLILIPVFMIYSHRHTMTQQTSVDIQYKYETNEVTSVDDLVEGHIYHLTIDGQSADEFMNSNGSFYCYLVNVNNYDFSSYSSMLDDVISTSYVDNGDILVEFVIEEQWSCFINTYLTFNNGNDPFSQITFDVDLSNFQFTLDADIVLTSYSNFYGYTILSQSDFNVIESVEVHDETSSVMNVFMDNFNGAIDKYFNMGNVFGMTNVYQWFNTNIFGGNAPTIIFSVWNIVLYEFVMDLIFLLYALFMWFIDITKRLIEKPLDSIK